ncbi:hypothetical protein TNCV_5066171 [Trichonephila clavipes]|nr:hypothetical protein TNCV_5066171 [Trichonephila clavipes]
MPKGSGSETVVHGPVRVHTAFLRDPQGLFNNDELQTLRGRMEKLKNVLSHTRSLNCPYVTCISIKNIVREGWRKSGLSAMSDRYIKGVRGIRNIKNRYPREPSSPERGLELQNDPSGNNQPNFQPPLNKILFYIFLH